MNAGEIASLWLKFSPVIEYLLIAGLLVLLLRQLLGERVLIFKNKIFQPIPPLRQSVRYFLLIFIFIVIASVVISTYLQYSAWQAHPFSQYLLPPHQPISYFINYTWQRFAKGPAVALLLAGIIFSAIKIANFFTQERLFYDEEPYLAAIAVLAPGWPNAFLLIALALILGVVTQAGFLIFSLITKKPTGRLPLIYFWLPLTLISMLWGDIIGKWVGLSQLKI